MMKSFTDENRRRFEELTGGTQGGPKGLIIGVVLGVLTWILIALFLRFLFFQG